MDRLAAKGQRNRSHIAIDDKESVRSWAKHFLISEEELRNVIGRVGNSASAVRKEISSKKQAKQACEHPPPEERLRGGDIASLEAEPSTDDDQPL